jgi:hypothetical protein
MKISLSLLLISIFLFGAPAFSEVLSEQTLQNDIRYYQKVSKQKNLGTNDRVYILKRIEEKYEGSDIDIDPLKRELQKAQSGDSEPAASPKPRTKTKPRKKPPLLLIQKPEK